MYIIMSIVHDPMHSLCNPNQRSIALYLKNVEIPINNHITLDSEYRMDIVKQNSTFFVTVFGFSSDQTSKNDYNIYRSE